MIEVKGGNQSIRLEESEDQVAGHRGIRISDVGGGGWRRQGDRQIGKGEAFAGVIDSRLPQSHWVSP